MHSYNRWLVSDIGFNLFSVFSDQCCENRSCPSLTFSFPVSPSSPLPTYPDCLATRTAPRQPAMAAARLSVPTCLLALLRCQLHLRPAAQPGTQWKRAREGRGGKKRKTLYTLSSMPINHRQIIALSQRFRDGVSLWKSQLYKTNVKVCNEKATMTKYLLHLGWISIELGPRGPSQFNILVPEVFLIQPLKIPIILGMKNLNYSWATSIFQDMD